MNSSPEQRSTAMDEKSMWNGWLDGSSVKTRDNGLTFELDGFGTLTDGRYRSLELLPRRTGDGVMRRFFRERDGVVVDLPHRLDGPATPGGMNCVCGQAVKDL